MSDPKAMREWLASRKNIPSALATAPEGPATNGEQVEATGAGATLNRLERSEVAAYSRLQRAIEEGDPLAIKTCRESWLRIADALRHYERAVSEDKRQRGLLVEKEGVERALRMFGWCMRIASTQMDPQIAFDIQGDSPELVRTRQLIRKANWGVAVIGYSSMYALGVPKWMVEALSADLISCTTITEEQLQVYANIIREAAQVEAQQTIAHEPKEP